MTNMNNTKKTNGSKKVNTAAITAIALTAVIGAGSIGGLALHKYMGTNKTAATTAYAVKKDNTATTATTVATVNTADTSAAEAKAAAKSAAQAQKDAEKALAQARTERAAAEKAAAQATAEKKAAAQKVAEQKKAAEKAAQKKADDAKKTAETKKKAAKKAEKTSSKKAVVDWSANFFYANGNSVKVNHYSNGRLVSADGIRYKDNGDGTLTGKDGSILFSTKEAADAYAQAQYKKANTVDWTATYYHSNGAAMNVCHYTDGRLVDDNGVEYKDNGDGTLTGTDGSLIFTTSDAACDYALAKYEQDFPEDWSATYYTATGDAVTIHHHTDGRYMTDDKTEYTVNADGSISTWGGDNTLFASKEAADAYAAAQYKAANPDQDTATETTTDTQTATDTQTTTDAQTTDAETTTDEQTIVGPTDEQIAAAQAQAEEEAERIAAENEAQAQAEAENQAAAQAQAEEEAQRIAAENEAAAENDANEQNTEEAQDQTADQTEQDATEAQDQNADQDQQNVEFTAEQQAALDKAMEDGQLTADEVVAMGLTVAQAQGLGLTVVNA